MKRPILYCCSALCVIAACISQAVPRPSETRESLSRADASAARAVAPYYYLGWGDPPDVQAVMEATGVKWFTLAFVIDAGSCEPRWDAERPLEGARDLALVSAIRAQGGDAMVSFGGQAGRTLEQHCPSSEALSAAYERVIAAYALSAIDIDLEGTSYRDPLTRARVVQALLAVRARHPQLAIYVTLASGTTGPDAALIDSAAHAGLVIDGWSIMTFDWGDTSDQQAQLTLQAAEQLKDKLIAAYGWSEDQAYRHAGISSMNGRSDENAFVSVADMRAITAYAKRHRLARLTFWAVNRDRPCPEIKSVIDHCSGLAQADWAYTRAISEYLR